MASADQARGARERDKLTIAEVCADLGISRRTFYEWRAKGRAPRCITLPNGSLRIRRSEYQRWLAHMRKLPDERRRPPTTSGSTGPRSTRAPRSPRTGSAGRWAARLWQEGFRTAAQADSFRSALMTAARKGEAFSLATGRPVAWERSQGRHHLVRVRLRLRGHEVEAGLGQVPQGHRPSA